MRKHRVGQSCSPIESLVHNSQWRLLRELLCPEVLDYMVWYNDDLNPPIVARALTKKNDDEVQNFIMDFMLKFERTFGAKIYSQRWFNRNWTFPTSVKITADSTWATMLAQAGNWMALCQLLHLMAMSSYN